jgi:hypothetical protein
MTGDEIRDEVKRALAEFLAEHADEMTAAVDAGPTLDQIKRWPATVDPARAGAAFGISRSYSYELIKSGEFPAQVIEVRGRTRVVTASILAALGGESA